ncbi:MAG: methyltransferase [Candidatus Andeanibacterium colombiense]|uniref:Methyltransferase n=1 Tax=Candidatus Andeanibacterium colombiense TaxID=3121345 RepID=A0AAJ5X6A2_9SPHN|nr:MAG: methyltransferase [Sphingomonadaceae bacterium]
MTAALIEPGTFAATSREAGALVQLLRYLKHVGYRFVTPTPASHERVLARQPRRPGLTREDVLGWSRPFVVGTVDPELERLLAQANVLVTEGALCRARIRVSAVQGHLFIHSAFPTSAEDSVFLGPDSYRFTDLIRRELRAAPLPAGSVILDIGTGAGVGAVTAAALSQNATVVATDLNPQALALAAINAQEAGHPLQTREGRDLAGFAEGIDLGLANPPYIIDPAGRTYRDGGGMHGAEVSIAMTRAGLAALNPGGRFILYTGSAIVGGADQLQARLHAMAAEGRFELRYEELDPDVFGEELSTPGYEDVDRIAVIAAVFQRRG